MTEERRHPDDVNYRQQRQPISCKTLEHILQVRKEIMEHTRGRVFEDSTEIIRQMREERTRELMGELSSAPDDKMV